MTILEPSVELWKEVDSTSHVARCARVCYGKETGNDERTISNLLEKQHLSMFRHSTCYYIVPKIYNAVIITLNACYNTIISSDIKPIGIDIKSTETDFYVVLNGHFILEHHYLSTILAKYKVSKDRFANTEVGYSMMRYTFACITQISTSRELNRVSPNNIVEQSTRYVYEDGCIVRPHWVNDKDVLDYYHYVNHQLDYVNTPAQTYLGNCECQFRIYKNLIESGIKKQDARGVLPLDTATKVIYTYSVDEWRHIISLRSDKRAHPNAQIISNMIKDNLEELGYDF